ncbi:hypothetical protein Tco_1554986 [Tanacetum coccineum]
MPWFTVTPIELAKKRRNRYREGQAEPGNPVLKRAFSTQPNPSQADSTATDSKKSHRVCQEKQRAFKRQKTFKPTIVDDQITPRDSDLVKHGVGKGLMAVRRLASQPARSHGMGKGFMAIQRLTQLGGRRVVNKVPEKKSSTRSKKVRCEQVDKEKQRRSGVCEIALVDGRIEEDPSQYAMLPISCMDVPFAKDSLLLGKLNISLLELLLTGVEKELDIEYVSHISKN